MESIVSLQITGLPQAERLLGLRIEPMLRPALRNIAQRIESRLKVYPRREAGSWARVATPAQRRAFFAQMRENGGDWKRTGLLGRSWTWEFTGGMGSYGARVYNPVRYAPWVQSRKFQANIHRGIWLNTDDNVVTEERPAAVREITDALQRGFRI